MITSVKLYTAEGSTILAILGDRFATGECAIERLPTARANNKTLAGLRLQGIARAKKLRVPFEDKT